MVSAISLAYSYVRINAPDPVLISNTRASVPLASFLLMMDDAINGIDSTVPVTSKYLNIKSIFN